MHFSHWRRMLVRMGFPQAEQYFWFGLGFLAFMSLSEVVVVGPIKFHLPDPAAEVL